MSLKKGKARRRRHPVAKIKGNWSSSDDAKLIRSVLQLPMAVCMPGLFRSAGVHRALAHCAAHLYLKKRSQMSDVTACHVLIASTP